LGVDGWDELVRISGIIDHPFRAKVTTHFGPAPKNGQSNPKSPVILLRNHWSSISEIGGQLTPKSAPNTTMIKSIRFI